MFSSQAKITIRLRQSVINLALAATLIFTGILTYRVSATLFVGQSVDYARVFKWDYSVRSELLRQRYKLKKSKSL